MGSRIFPVQLCQFHQVVSIRRYMTKNPKMLTSIDLKALVDMVKNSEKESFEGRLERNLLRGKTF